MNSEVFQCSLYVLVSLVIYEGRLNLRPFCFVIVQDATGQRGFGLPTLILPPPLGEASSSTAGPLASVPGMQQGAVCDMAKTCQNYHYITASAKTSIQHLQFHAKRHNIRHQKCPFLRVFLGLKIQMRCRLRISLHVHHTRLLLVLWEVVLVMSVFL